MVSIAFRICLVIVFLSNFLSLFADLYVQSFEGYYKLTQRETREQLDLDLFCTVNGIGLLFYANYNQKIAFVSDKCWNRIVYTDLNPSSEEGWIYAYGSDGTGEGQFIQPQGITTDNTTDRVYVADTYNDRVVVLQYNPADNSLSYEYSIEGYGLERPKDVIFKRVNGIGKVYVLEQENHRFLRFRDTGTFELSFGDSGSGPGEFINPRSIDKYGDYIYINDWGNSRIQILYEDDNGDISYYAEYPVSAYIVDISVDDFGNVYLFDAGNRKIIKYSPLMEEWLFSFGSKGYGRSQFFWPVGILSVHNHLDVVALEDWTDETGFRAYYSKIKIWNAEVSKSSFDATEEEVQISFKIDDAADVTVNIMKGDTIIRTLINTALSAGSHSESFLIWDGKVSGDLALPGDYTIKITAVDGYGGEDIEYIPIRVKGTVISSRYVKGVWSPSGSPYVVTRDDQIEVDAGDVLRINPGTKVMWRSNTYLLVWGNLIARGTEQDTIEFLPYQKYEEMGEIRWKGIELNRTIGSPQGGDTITYFELGYCGDENYPDKGMIDITERDSVEISNGYIHHTTNIGVKSHKSFVTLSDLHFSDIDGYPVSVGGLSSITPVIHNITADSTVEKRAVWIGDLCIYGTRTLENTIPYVIGAVIDVKDTLIVEPSAVVKFSGNETSIFVSDNALIYAEGTPDSIIYFTSKKNDDAGGDTNGDGDNSSPQAGDWSRIQINGSSGYFDWCEFSYGGNPGQYSDEKGMISYRPNNQTDVSLVIKNSKIMNSDSIGILLYGDNEDISIDIEDNIFDGNDGNAIKISELSPVVKNNKFYNHKSDEYLVYVQNGLPEFSDNEADTTNKKAGIRLNILSNIDRNWTLGGWIPYVVDYVTAYDTLVLSGGVIMKFLPDGELTVNSLLLVDGSPYIVDGKSRKVILTSIYDDNAGGDTNGDGDATEPQPGDWQGVTADGSSSTGLMELKHFRIRYAQNGLYIKPGTSSRIRYGWITDNENYGIWMDVGSGATIDIERSAIMNNSYGIYNTGAGAGNHTVNLCNIVNNTDYGVYNAYSSAILNAEDNWWGSATGPFHPDSNPDGGGDAVSDYVDFIPYRTQPVPLNIAIADIGIEGKRERVIGDTGMSSSMSLASVISDITSSDSVVVSINLDIETTEEEVSEGWYRDIGSNIKKRSVKVTESRIEDSGVKHRLTNTINKADVKDTDSRIAIKKKVQMEDVSDIQETENLPLVFTIGVYEGVPSGDSKELMRKEMEIGSWSGVLDFYSSDFPDGLPDVFYIMADPDDEYPEVDEDNNIVVFGERRVEKRGVMSDSLMRGLVFRFYLKGSNPARGIVRFGYDLPVGGEVSLKVYSADGRLVRVLESGIKAPGRYVVIWRGDDERGRRVSGGVYFLKFSSTKWKGIKQIVLLQ